MYSFLLIIVKFRSSYFSFCNFLSYHYLFSFLCIKTRALKTDFFSFEDKFALTHKFGGRTLSLLVLVKYLWL